MVEPGGRHARKLVRLQRQIDDLTRRIKQREAEIADAEKEREAVRGQADRAAIEAVIASVAR